MNANLAIGIGIIAGIAAAGLCVLAHRLAKKRRWGFIERYVSGVFICLVAFAFPLFGSFDFVDAGVMFCDAALIFGFAGAATWLAHDSDPDPPRSPTPDADRVLSKLDGEIGQK